MRILFVATQLPLPLDTGGKIRSLNIIKHLAQEHDVTFVCATDATIDDDLLRQMRTICTSFVPAFRQPDRNSLFYFLKLLQHVAAQLPLGIAKDYSPALARQIRYLVSTGNFDVLVCDFLHASINLGKISSLPVVLFQHNVEAEILRRHYLHARNPFARLFWFYQWKRMRSYERRSTLRVDRCISVSQTDRRTLERDYGLGNVSAIDTGVDVDYFSGQRVRRISNRLVFTGSMDWLPNEDAMQFFVRQVLPLIAQVIPDVSLTIVGRYPSSQVLKLRQSSPQVLVTGTVDDVRPYLAEGAVFVVPLRIGSGTRIKIFEAMASGIPVVSTSVGAEGLPVEDQRHLLLADTPNEFAEAVITLLQNANMARQIAENALNAVIQNNDWKIVARQFGEICRNAIGQKRGSPDED